LGPKKRIKEIKGLVLVPYLFHGIDKSSGKWLNRIFFKCPQGITPPVLHH
jgi:hypothetical protein